MTVETDPLAAHGCRAGTCTSRKGKKGRKEARRRREAERNAVQVLTVNTWQAIDGRIGIQGTNPKGPAHRERRERVRRRGEGRKRAKGCVLLVFHPIERMRDKNPAPINSARTQETRRP
jgi:hypothetical protein